VLKLRPYQRDAIDAIVRARRAGTTRPAVVLPTGSGKTVVFAHDVKEWRESDEGRGRRALVLAHRTELIEQAAGKLHSVAPEMRIGIVKGARNQTLADVVVGSVQTLRGDRRLRQLIDVGLVVVDECHHATADSYLKILESLGCMRERNPVPAVGYTATMVRGDDKALGAVWQDVVYTRTIAEMIRDGFLVRPRGIRVKVEDLDFSRVRKTRGDYSEHDLGEALEASMAPEAIAKAYLEHASNRPGILFAPTVSSAAVIADALSAAGISTGLVHGETPVEERRRTLREFADGKIQVLANCMVLTEGFDSPNASCVVIARPTTHKGLYIQMVGRALRLYPGKSDALVLDVTGASQRHALSSAVELFGEEPERADEDESGDELTDEVGDDEVSLGEALDETVYAQGELVSIEVDLFHGSESAWLRTYGGTWFLPAGERYIAILPAPRAGAYDVVAMHRYRVGESRWVVRDVDELSYAMAHAESDVTPIEQTLARKERSWRAKRPSEPQRALAMRLGLGPLDGMFAGEASNLISQMLASQRIDARASMILASYARV
jgi:superfamily II DNA or RNA helicase